MSCHDFKNSAYTYIIPGVLSAMASSCVVVTCVIFSDLRKLRYIELVFYASISDFFLSVAIALGPTRDGTAACLYQGFASNYFAITAFFWVTVINYQVWLIVYEGKVLKDLTLMHLTGWIFPILTTFLVYTTNAYGVTMDDDEESKGWCFIVDTSFSPRWTDLFWVLMSFYVWIWLGILVNIGIVLSITYRIRRMNIVSKQMWQTISKLVHYPLVLIFCWITASLFDINEYTSSYRSNAFDCLSGLATFTAALQGFMFAVVFFTMNSIVREKWISTMVICGLLRVESLEQHRKAHMRVRETFEAKNVSISADRRFSIADEEDYIGGDDSIFGRTVLSISLSWFAGRDPRSSNSLPVCDISRAPITNPIRVMGSSGTDINSTGVGGSSPEKAIEMLAT